MALNKQAANFNFAQGLDRKSDPFQIPIGRFFSLENSIFTKAGLLEKRNGYGELTALPDATSTYITTFNNNLSAISTSLNAYSSSTQTWVSKGSFQPLVLSTLPLIRNSTNQTQVDSAISSNGLICTIYTDVTTAGTLYRYAISNSITGQNIVPPTSIVPTSGTVSNGLRVFILGGYFVIVYSTSTNHLQYVRLNISNPTATIEAASDITTSYTGVSTVAWDGVVTNNTLYLAWNGNDGGGAIRMTSYNSSFTRGTSITGTNIANAKAATIVSVCADETQSTPVIWVSFYTTVGPAGYSVAVSPALAIVLAATSIIGSGTILNLATAAFNQRLYVMLEVSTVYSYGGGLATNHVDFIIINQVGATINAGTAQRSIGLASKAFLMGTTLYFMGVYSSSYQPTYFLLRFNGDLTTPLFSVSAKLAYQNAGGYLTLGLPSVSVSSSSAFCPYLVKDLVTAVNKNTNIPAGSQTAGIYAQTGINLAEFDFTATGLTSSEIGSNLHLTGGFLSAYDGYSLTEQGFHLYPDNVISTTTTGAGSIAAGTYYYVTTYEWSDNQGNLFRSAPSIPISQVTTTASSTNTINVPTLRLTSKIDNPVKIVLYRWSTAQQSYYQVTSLTAPKMNDRTIDSISIIDTFADATILGNSLLYTTGGVVENIGAPAANATALYKSRLFLIPSENPNIIQYSKKVIEGTPVELSDLFTLYVAPTTGAQGSTGINKTIAPLDDKLIIGKKDALYYISGEGPDNTGANNDFTEPVFITSNIGCENQSSIVFQPNGLMFETDKGIWLLGRDLSTNYIGSPVEAYTQNASVLSAQAIPGTNQVRFILDSGITLVYDYFYNQWGTFVGVPAISSTLYQGLHTFLNSYGKVFQETPGVYLDGSRPVLMSFTTGWLNMSGLQGYQRAYRYNLLGTYLTPHILTISTAYDYNSSSTQVSRITPDNYSGNYGDSALYGSDEFYGGYSNVEQWRVDLEQQKCEAIQITVAESFDASLGTVAGAGLTLSGVNIIYGTKSSYPRLQPGRQVG